MRRRPSEAIDLNKYRVGADVLAHVPVVDSVSGADVAGRLAAADGRAGLPPTNNMGGKSAPEANGGERHTVFLLLDGGKTKEVTLRAGWGGDLAHVDQVSFTVHEDTCCRIASRQLVSDKDYIIAMSQKLEEIFGFGVARIRERGMNFYKNTFVLGQEEVPYGHLSVGGQRDTLLVQITGTGAMAAHDGWEKRLYTFLSEVAVRPRITRIDLAYDDLDGDYSVDEAYADVGRKGFNTGGRNPFVEKRSDWDNPDGSGRTLYIGKRANGKYCRVYEKGRQLGCSSSPWVRVEVEYKSVGRVIPFETLIDAGAYFAGAYPAFERFRGRKTPTRIKTSEVECSYAYDHAIHYAALQVGRLVNFLREQCGASVDDIVKKLARPGAGYPKRLTLANWACDAGNRDFIHHDPMPAVDPYFMNRHAGDWPHGCAV